MGDLSVHSIRSEELRQHFMLHLTHDVQALELMLQGDYFEQGKERIGAEQELCLINDLGEPSMVGPEVLEHLTDPHFTTEIARYNLEINLDPVELRSDCLRSTERQLLQLLGMGRRVASERDARILLTGILPTLTHRHFTRDHMTPRTRYYALDEEMRAQRGGPFEIHLHGADELMMSHESMLLEACNTSFQLHLQVAPEDYVTSYNWAQMISAPVLAAAVNSPLLFGRELWAETRIALFQQSVDTRRSSVSLRDRQPRVFFGNRWLKGSIAELFKDHISRFSLILAKEIEEDALAVVKSGKAAELSALRLHNGTVYNWNRPCYGVVDGRAHLRIECRYLPAGPTVVDEMANFAFWLGLMKGRPEAYNDFQERVSFKVIKDNFYRAARNGQHVLLCWMDREWPADQLICDELLPIAREGLRRCGVNQADADRYLGIIEARISRGRTGAQWIVNNFRRLANAYGVGVATVALAQGMHRRQESGDPVHTWTDIDSRRVYVVNIHRDKVGQFMSTDLFTVQGGEPLGLVKSIMEWKHIRHLPVEDEDGRLIGLVTANNLRMVNQEVPGWEKIPIREIMVQELHTITPDTPVKTAAELMKVYAVGCLPIVHEDRLLGLITDTDMRRLHINGFEPAAEVQQA